MEVPNVGSASHTGCATPPQQQWRRPTRSTVIASIVFLAAFSAGNFVLGANSHHDVLRSPVTVWFGVPFVCTQLIAGGALVALTTSPFWFRQAVCWSVTLLYLQVWTLGFYLYLPNVFESDFGYHAITFTLAATPILILIAQTPLWIGRCVFGWRIVQMSQSPPITDGKLTIADLLTATAVVAGVLSMQRTAPWNLLPLGRSTWDLIIHGAGPGFVVLCVTSAIVRVVLGTRRLSYVLTGLVLLAAALVSVALTLAIAGGARVGSGLLTMAAYLLLLIVTPAAALGVIRLFGFRLVTRRGEERSATRLIATASTPPAVAGPPAA